MILFYAPGDEESKKVYTARVKEEISHERSKQHVMVVLNRSLCLATCKVEHLVADVQYEGVYVENTVIVWS